jgi:hypothetical protein
MPLHDQKQHPCRSYSTGVPTTSSKSASRLSRYVLSDVYVKHDALVESEFLFLTFRYRNTRRRVFPRLSLLRSNQIGNTAVLATVVAGLIGDLVPLSNIGMSLAMFLAGGSIMGQIGNPGRTETEAMIVVEQYSADSYSLCSVYYARFQRQSR